MPKTIKIATRKSPLALWQAEEVKRQLIHHHPGIQVELVKMSTQGDKILDTPLAKIGGKGLFIKELEAGMLAGDADIAVHSMKDVPAEFPEGLMLSTIMQREDPTDAFVCHHYEKLTDLPEGAVVGTSSLRRQSQILHLRPDLHIKSLRGNVNTRLSKLDDGEFDAIILASAGLIRLGFEQRISARFSTEQCIPGIGQGAVGIECREDDEAIQQLLLPLACSDSTARVSAERQVNSTLNGGCQAPIAAYAVLEDQQLHMTAMVASTDGQKMLYAKASGAIDEAEKVGLVAAKQLQMLGALPLLQAARLD